MNKRAKKRLTQRMETRAAWTKFSINSLGLAAEIASLAFKDCMVAMGNLEIKEKR